MVLALPLPDDARQRLELALQEAGILPAQVRTLAEHGCAIVPLIHDRARREAVDIKVYTHALIAVQLGIGDVQRLRDALAEKDRRIQELLEACEAAATWLRGWASAEPYLDIIERVIGNTEEGR